jgi:hypothetical protein
VQLFIEAAMQVIESFQYDTLLTLMQNAFHSANCVLAGQHSCGLGRETFLNGVTWYFCTNEHNITVLP